MNTPAHEKPAQTPALTPEIAGQIADIVRVTPVFSSPEEPILGATDEVVVAPNLDALLHDPDTTLAVTTEGKKVTGFSVAVPVGRFDRTKEARSADTAYIYYTGIEPSLRGRGLVGPLMEKMYGLLRDKGYKRVERDAVLDQGWADKVQRSSPEGAIMSSHDHTTWEEVGPQRFFEMDLSKLGVDKPE